jgi:putative transposase
MRTSKFTPDQMVHILRQGDSGVPVVELCRQHGISEQTFYRWKRRFGDLGTAEVRELRQLREENRKLKQVVADLTDVLRFGEVEHDLLGRIETRHGLPVDEDLRRAGPARGSAVALHGDLDGIRPSGQQRRVDDLIRRGHLRRLIRYRLRGAAGRRE